MKGKINKILLSFAGVVVLIVIILFVYSLSKNVDDKCVDNKEAVSDTTIDVNKKISEAEAHISQMEDDFIKAKEMGKGDDLYYKYPDVTGLSKYEQFRLCRISEKVLSLMDVDQLAQAIIDYPFLDEPARLSSPMANEFIEKYLGAYVRLREEYYCKHYLMEKLYNYSLEATHDENFYERMENVKNFILSQKNLKDELSAYDIEFLECAKIEEVEFTEKSREIGWFDDININMVKLTNMQDIEDFKNEYKELADVEFDFKESGLNSIFQGYNENFLAKNDLYVTYYRTGIMNNKHYAGNVYLVSGNHLKMEINSNGSFGNCAISGHLIVIAVSKDISDKCESYSSYYFDESDNYY